MSRTLFVSLYLTIFTILDKHKMFDFVGNLPRRIEIKNRIRGSIQGKLNSPNAVQCPTFSGQILYKIPNFSLLIATFSRGGGEGGEMGFRSLMHYSLHWLN